jgi:hypothetical protein
LLVAVVSESTSSFLCAVPTLAQELNFDWELSAKGKIWLIEDGMNATEMTSALFSTTLADLQVRADRTVDNDFQATFMRETEKPPR